MRAVLVVGVVAVAGCAGAQEAVRPSEPAPMVAPSASASAPPVIDVLPEDPRHVRCGIDDAPRRVSQALPAVERALLGDRALPGEFVAEPFEAPARPLSPPVRVDLGVATVAGRAVRAGQLSGLDGEAGFAVCDGLFEAGDARRVVLSIKLASTGAPLVVSGVDAPSPYLRCALERACQARADASLGGATVSLPVTFSRDDMQKNAQSGAPVRVRVDRVAFGDALAASVTREIEAAFSSCAQRGMTPPAGGTVNLVLSSKKRTVVDVRGRRGRGRAPSRRTITEHEVSSVSIGGLGQPSPLGPCLTGRLRGVTFPATFGAGGSLVVPTVIEVGP